MYLLFDDRDVDLGCVDFLIELWWKLCGAQQSLIHIRGDTIQCAVAGVVLSRS